jgi:hypothetical protein
MKCVVSFFAILLLGSSSVGCSSGSSDAPPDASTSGSDGGGDGGPGDVVGTCTPSPGFAGNAKHVGAYCSPNGGQCATYGNSLVQCSIDLSPQGSDFCILIGCQADTDCGQDGCCTGESGNPIHACVPSGCFDAGICPGIPQ